jgi:hypothetical protein
MEKMKVHPAIFMKKKEDRKPGTRWWGCVPVKGRDRIEADHV